MTIALIKENIEYAAEHYQQSLRFYEETIALIPDQFDQIFVKIADSNSVYITVYSDENQSNERVYRFSDHSNCRYYTNAVNVAPSADSFDDAIKNVKQFLGAK